MKTLIVCVEGFDEMRDDTLCDDIETLCMDTYSATVISLPDKAKMLENLLKAKPCAMCSAIIGSGCFRRLTCEIYQAWLENKKLIEQLPEGK